MPLWIRHVVVPGLTDREEHLLKIAETAVRFSNLQKLELLRKLCLPKYRAMALLFPLESYDECKEAKISELYRIISERLPQLKGIPTV